MGYILWNIDNQFCDNLRSIRQNIGLPWAWLLELHGWYVSFFIALPFFLRLLFLPILHSLGPPFPLVSSLKFPPWKLTTLPNKVAHPHRHSSLPPYFTRRVSLPCRFERAAAIRRSHTIWGFQGS
jgi:hypothetical protein